MFRRSTETEYKHSVELRSLDSQIATLIGMIGQMEARLRRDGELSHANAHQLNEYRVELAQRRERYRKLTSPGRGEMHGRFRMQVQSARHRALQETHVVVGDHDPEPRQFPNIEEVRRSPEFADFTREMREKTKGPRPYHKATRSIEPVIGRISYPRISRGSHQ